MKLDARLDSPIDAGKYWEFGLKAQEQLSQPSTGSYGKPLVFVQTDPTQ
jgi:hypothetical protein